MNYPSSTGTVSVQQIIEAEIQSVWTGLGHPATSINWPNTDFAPPRNGFWLEPVINFGQSQPMIFYGSGAGINQKISLLLLTVRGPKTVGLLPYYEIAQAFLAHFNRTHYGGVYAQINDGPLNLSEDALAAVQVAIELRYYESAG